MHNPGRAFRDLLRTEPYLFTGGVYSPLDAQIAERVGMKSIYLSGYSMALANGWPDMGFLTQTEVTRIGAMVASAVEIPVIADADDGYGNALSTIRTVQEYVRSGVAGIHIEDQVFPKRCGHIAGKTIIARGSGRGEIPRGRRYPRPDEPGLRHHRPHRRLRRGGRQPAGSHPPRPRLRRRRRGPVWPELSSPDREPAVAFAKAMRESHPNAPARLQLLVLVQVAQGRQPLHLQRAGRARLQVHLHHALRRPRRHVRGVERHGRAGARPRSRPSGAWRRPRTAIRPRATT